jgi:hypothetical protein
MNMEIVRSRSGFRNKVPGGFIEVHGFRSRYSRKILAPPKLVACRRENSVLILLTGVVNFTLKELLSLAGFFSSNTILPKNRSPFYVFKRVLLSKFRFKYFLIEGL